MRNGCGNDVPMETQNGFHSDLEISHRTRDSHIPTTHPHPSHGREKGHRAGDSDLVLTSIGRRIVAASATFRTGKNGCRQTAKVVDVDQPLTDLVGADGVWPKI